jgi:hypothetical protein
MRSRRSDFTVRPRDYPGSVLSTSAPPGRRRTQFLLPDMAKKKLEVVARQAVAYRVQSLCTGSLSLSLSLSVCERECVERNSSSRAIRVIPQELDPQRVKSVVVWIRLSWKKDKACDLLIGLPRTG